MMEATPEKQQFEAGLAMLGRDDVNGALKAFEGAYRHDNEEPRYMSYYGLCIAARRGAIGMGINLCVAAIKKEFRRAEFYLNLGRIYKMTGNRKGATNAFRKGLRFDPKSEPLKKELADLRVGGSRMIPFIKKPNPLSRLLDLVFGKETGISIHKQRRRGFILTTAKGETHSKI